jgi:regulator of RNase E activity RraA
MFSPGNGTSICGPAITVKMIRTGNPGPTPPIHFADANKPGHIMFIQQPKKLPSACWGGLMSTRAQKLGSLGTIVDGRMRDTQEHIDMKYPVCNVLLTPLVSVLNGRTNVHYRSLRAAQPSSGQPNIPVRLRSMSRFSTNGIFGFTRVIFWWVMRTAL